MIATVILLKADPPTWWSEGDPRSEHYGTTTNKEAAIRLPREDAAGWIPEFREHGIAGERWPEAEIEQWQQKTLRS